MPTTKRGPYPFVTKVIDMFGEWLKHRRELNELTEYEAEFGELERVARDLNATTPLARDPEPSPSVLIFLSSDIALD